MRPRGPRIGGKTVKVSRRHQSRASEGGGLEITQDLRQTGAPRSPRPAGVRTEPDGGWIERIEGSLEGGGDTTTQLFVPAAARFDRDGHLIEVLTSSQLAAYRLEQKSRLQANTSGVTQSPGLGMPSESVKVSVWTRFLSLIGRGDRGRP